MEVLQQTGLPTTISGVLKYLAAHPVAVLIRGWHWKTALMSGLIRSSIFFIAYFWKKEGLAIALGAMLAQFVSRAFFGGINGAIIQSFSRVEPAWHATLTVPLVLAAFSHVVEYAVQTAFDSYVGTISSGKAIATSVFISVISAVFNLFAMRRGVLLVKDSQQQSLWKDLKQVPKLIVEFLGFVPTQMWEMARRGQYVLAVATALTTSVGIGVSIGMIRRKASWGFITASSVFVVLIVLAVLIAVVSARRFRQLEMEYTSD